MKKLFFSLFILVFASSMLVSQITINEYSASNLNGFTDSYQRTEDWIELYNMAPVAIDIGGWHLSDKETNPTKYEIPEGTMIPGNGFLVFWCSGRDLKNGNEFHTSFKLTQTSGTDILVLADADGNIIESHPMELTLVENSRCRENDGTDQWRVCTEPTPGNSNNSAAQFLSYTQEPSMDLIAGFFSGPQKLTLTNNEPNSVLRYTIDGTNPTSTSPEYVDTIEINQTTVIKAQSFSNDAAILTGKMNFNTYFIDEDFSLPVFSVAADQVIELANGNGPLIPIGSLEYFNKNKQREAKAFGSLNRHGQDSWALDHRSLDWVTRDEMGYSKAVIAPLFNYSDRNEYQKFMFRNSGDDNYPAIDDADHEGSTHIRDEYVQQLSQDGGMQLDSRNNERVVLFLNGQYWGVYGMRERPVDHDYTDEYYNQGKYDIQYLSTWGDTEIEYGGPQAETDWINLRDFILSSDMSDPANYKIAHDSIDMLSLIDYMIVNLTVVASDWLNYNTGWWRGLNPNGGHQKWGYILWDLDATFDYYINYSGVPNTDPDAVPCDLEEIADFMDFFFFFAEDVGQHEKIFLKLLDENETFKQLYYSRQADMMNTVYSCENMITTLDSMLAIIEPEMPRQIQRWGGTIGEWESNVQDLKDFINARCELLDDGMLDCYDELNGPYEVTLLTEPANVGTVDFNTLSATSFPWVGDYFGGMDNLLEAKVLNDLEDQYKFSHWESTTGSMFTPDEFSRKGSVLLAGADTITAVFEMIDTLINTEDIVINEFMASNDSLSQIADSNGEFDDWIEIYNNSDQSIDLSGVYLSDDADDLKKWKFPSGLEIMGNEYLIAWADNDENQSGLHTNFKLSKAEGVIFMSDITNTVIDSIIYGEQETNVAFARIPNGTGDFVSQAPTFKANNEATSTEEIDEGLKFNVFPNPTNDLLTIEFDLSNKTDLEIVLYSLDGKKIKEVLNEKAKASGNYSTQLSLGQFASGMYFLRFQTDQYQSAQRITIMD